MTTSENRLSDSDLTVLVERAAEGVWDSKLPDVEGLAPWCDLHPASKNTYREQVLPVIFHGTKALQDLGYRKPSTITTIEELDALPDGSAVLDGVVCVKRADGYWNFSDLAGVYASASITLPATVLHEPEAEATR